MRIWSLHPKYLDSKGVVALWRESLHARKVLQGKTKGYKHHPQLKRFKEAKNPIIAIDSYLCFIFRESLDRKYNFDESKICYPHALINIPVTKGQVEYEFRLLKYKLKKRDKAAYRKLLKVKRVKVHPLFRVVKGPVECWEKVKSLD